MSTFPDGNSIISTYGMNLLLDGTDPLIVYTSPDGNSRFMLSGGLAPYPGVQDGVVLAEGLGGLHPPFKHLDQAGARQDGTTWLDTVYDPAEITATFDAYATTATGLNKVVQEWIGAWDPKKRGKLEWFTYESGLWWCFPRLNKAWPDQLKQSPRRHKKQRFTASIRNDDAFWIGPDSISSTFKVRYDNYVENFLYLNSTSLGSNWTQLYSGSGSGKCIVVAPLLFWNKNHALWSDPGGNSDRVVVNRWHLPMGTDNHVVTMQMGGWPGINFPQSAYNDIWARMDAGSSYSTINGIRLRISATFFVLSRFVNGAETVMFSRPLLAPPVWDENWTLVAGTGAGARTYQLLRNGIKIMDYTEDGTNSHLGSGYRYCGFGMESGAGLLVEAQPAAVEVWTAADNTAASDSGYITLTNLGDQPAWPRYLLYGPGTFTIGQPGTTNTVSLGPLLDGQIVLLTTQPRLRSVVDLTMTDQPTQSLNIFQKLIAALTNFVSANNTPPLLQAWESMFGILPPQGPLYSLLSGRFANPIPGVPTPSQAVDTQIPITVTGGGPNSGAVAAVTPMRRWPE